MSAAAAKFISQLKIKEKEPYASQIGSSGSDSGVDAALAGVESELVNGRLLQAAAKLEAAVKGTAAEMAVKDWIAAAKARAVAEQAVAVVEAHAATATVSLT